MFANIVPSFQQKAREEKEHKRGRLDARHNYLLRTVAEHLQVKLRRKKYTAVLLITITLLNLHLQFSFIGSLFIPFSFRLGHKRLVLSNIRFPGCDKLYLVQVPQADIEDNILEGFQIELMDQFFLKPSVSLIMFCAPKMEPAEAATTTTTTTATTGWSSRFCIYLANFHVF